MFALFPDRTASATAPHNRSGQKQLEEDIAMSRLFKNYERELTAATRDVSRGISGIGSAQGEARKQKIRAVETRLDTCDQILSQMVSTKGPKREKKRGGVYFFI